MVDFVPEVLCWKSAVHVHERLLREHLSLLSDRFDEALNAFARAGVGKRLCQLVRTLPESSLDRIRTAPETAHRLMYGEPTDLVFFLGAVLAEGCRIGEVEHLSQGVWTALGDFYFPPGPVERQPPPTEEHFQWTEGQPLRAPCLSSGSPVDHVSPFARRTVGLSYVPYVSFEEEEIRGTIGKVDAALKGIAAVSPESFELIRAFTRVLVLRKDQVDPHAFGSFSTASFIGRMAFSNAHAQFAAADRLANGLVHEAIHSMLYIVEEKSPFIAEPTAAMNVKVQSPWSGRWLELHSFLHACYVWFGLWQFWLAVEGEGAFPVERASALRDRARSGFDNPVILASLKAAEPYLAEAGHAIPELVRAVRRGAYA